MDVLRNLYCDTFNFGDYSSCERESIRIKFPLNSSSVANEIFRYGYCKLETKHFKLNRNARFINLKSKTI